jgi:hypothetical protein
LSGSEIVLAPGSSKPISRVLNDGNGVPLDFTVGTWSALLKIFPYPGYVGVPFTTLTTPGVTVSDGTKQEWLSFLDGRLVITPDPLVTVDWQFSRYHYDCFLTGPNINSSPERVGHGPFRMDW